MGVRKELSRGRVGGRADESGWECGRHDMQCCVAELEVGRMRAGGRVGVRRASDGLVVVGRGANWNLWNMWKSRK